MNEMFDPTKSERTWEMIKESCGIDDKNTIKTLAHRNYGFFFEHVLGYKTSSPVTKQAIRFHQNPDNFKETSDDMDAIKAAVVAPRGHSKTVSWTIGPTLWRMWKETGKEILISSASSSQSKDILADIKRIIVRNDALQHLEPTPGNIADLGGNCDIRAKESNWAAESVTATSDVTVQTKTFGSSIRSKHVDYVFLDDVLQDENSGTRSTEQEKDTFYNVISPIVENKGGVLQIVGTPMSHDDLLMELVEKDNFHITEYEAFDPETEQVLWPEKWSIDGLKQKKAEIGPARFAREYQCVREGTGIITMQGTTPIEDINVGDKVLGETGYTEVKETFDTESEELIEIEVARKRTVEVTPDHPVKVVEQRYNIKEHDKGFYHIPSKHGYESKWVEASEIDRGDIVLFPKPKKTGSEHDISDAALELAGWYVAEGHSYDYTKVDAKNWSMGIAQKDKEAREHFKDLFEEVWDYDATVGEKETRCFTARICEYYHHFFGGRSEEKKLPVFVHNLSERQFNVLFDAMMDGDGSYNDDRGRYTYTTNSKTLAYQLKVLLRKFGISATMSETEMDTNNIWNLNWSENGSHFKWMNEGAMYERVTAVNKKEGSFSTFNLHTEDNTYTTSEMLVHNCDPMSVEEQYFSMAECLNPNLDASHYKPNTALDKYSDWDFSVGVDVALSDKGDSDYNVFTVIGEPRDREEKYVVEIVRYQSMSPEGIANTLEELDNKYEFREGLYEKNAQGEGLYHEMQDRPGLRTRIKGFDTTRKSRPQILSRLQAALYRQELKIVDKEGLVSEMAAFRKNSRGKLEGKGHDDTVMSLAIAYNCIEGGEEGEVGIGVIGLGNESEENNLDIDMDETGIVGDGPVKDDEENEMNIGIV